MFRAMTLALSLLAVLCSPVEPQEQSRSQPPQAIAPAGSRPTRALEHLVAQERESPTTEENLEMRGDAFYHAIIETGNPPRYVPAGAIEFIQVLEREGKRAEAAANLRAVILGAEKALSSGPAAATGAPAGVQSLRLLVALEKESPTTEKNFELRGGALHRALVETGDPTRYLPAGAVELMEELKRQGKLAEAAARLRAIILGTERALSSGPAAATGASGSVLAVEHLVALEKASPTTEKNLEMRGAAFHDAITKTGDPTRYIPAGAIKLIQDLERQGKRAEAAAQLRATILGMERRLSPRAAPARPATLTAERPPVATDAGGKAASSAAQPSAPGEADRIGASTLYFKAMQEYARGNLPKALSLLESGAKLDPASQDIANALRRLRMER